MCEREITFPRTGEEDIMANQNTSKTVETLLVPEQGIGEFFVADFAKTAVPQVAREVAATAPQGAVVVYVRPYGPHGTTMGGATAQRRAGQPKLLWERVKKTLAGSWEQIGELQQSLWALLPGDVLYVHTAGRAKNVECYLISRPNKDRTLVATRVPSKFDRETGREVGTFDATFVEGAWREIEARKAREAEEQAEAARQRTANATQKPVFEPRLLSMSERRMAIGLKGITLEDETFHYGESIWDLREYTEAEVDRTEAEVLEEEAKNTEKKEFEAGFEALKPRMEVLGIVFYDHEDCLCAKAPDAQFSESFLYTLADLARLHTFVDLSSERAESAKKKEVERQAAAILEQQRLLDEAVRFQAIMLAHSQLPDDLKSVSSYDAASWTYGRIAGRNGVQMYQAYDDRRYVSRVNHSRPFGERCDNAEAQVIYRVACAGGALELLAFQKYGGWNLHMRWRERVEEVPQVVEVVKAPTEPEPQVIVGKVTTFTDIGGRCFRCGCGNTVRVDKSTAKAFLASGTLDLSCTACDGHGSVSR